MKQKKEATVTLVVRDDDRNVLDGYGDDAVEGFTAGKRNGDNRNERDE